MFLSLVWTINIELLIFISLTSLLSCSNTRMSHSLLIPSNTNCFLTPINTNYFLILLILITKRFLPPMQIASNLKRCLIINFFLTVIYSRYLMFRWILFQLNLNFIFLDNFLMTKIFRWTIAFVTYIDIMVLFIVILWIIFGSVLSKT